MTPLPWMVLLFLLAALGARPELRPHPAVLLLLSLAYAGLRRRRGSILVLAACTVGLALGGTIPNGIPRRPVAVGAGLLEGRVVRGCARVAEATRCDLETGDGRGMVLRVESPGRCDARPGDLVRAVARVRPVTPEVNDVRLGSGAGLLRRGVDWSAVAAGCEPVDAPPGPLEGVRRAGARLRAELVAGLAAALGAGPAARARSVLFGDDDGLSAEELAAFRDSGLAHLLAVSGAHVALLAGLLGGIARALLRRVPAVAARGQVDALAALAPLPMLGVFVAATGESPASVRALVAAGLATLARVAGRRPHGEATVAASAGLTAVASPALLLDAGWQLSAVAAWALSVRASTPREDPSADDPGIGASLGALLGEALRAGARVSLAVMPVLAWHFGRTPLTATLANLVAAPVAEALVLPGVLAVGALGRVNASIGRLLGLALRPLLDAVLALPLLAVQLPLSSVALPPPTPAQAVVGILGVLIGLRLRGVRRRAVCAAVVALIAVGLEFAHLHYSHPTGVLRVTALDVGQGDAILVDLPDGTAMLIDGGGIVGPGPDPGARVVVPALADRRRRRLVAVVASHPHPDHIGGLAAVLSWAEAEELWDTRQGERFGSSAGSYGAMRGAAHARHIAVRGPETLCGPPRAFHGALLEVLAPCPGVADGVSANDGSFVLRLRFGRASVLLPGDLERGGEATLAGKLGPVTVLKLGHHGSRTSSTDGFLRALRPRVALVSAGHPSPFGHPHQVVRDRVASVGAALYSTAELGAVAVTLWPGGRFRVDHGRGLLGGF